MIENEKQIQYEQNISLISRRIVFSEIRMIKKKSPTRESHMGDLPENSLLQFFRAFPRRKSHQHNPGQRTNERGRFPRFAGRYPVSHLQWQHH